MKYYWRWQSFIMMNINLFSKYMDVFWFCYCNLIDFCKRTQEIFCRYRSRFFVLYWQVRYIVVKWVATCACSSNEFMSFQLYLKYCSYLLLDFVEWELSEGGFSYYKTHVIWLYVDTSSTSGFQCYSELVRLKLSFMHFKAREKWKWVIGTKRQLAGFSRTNNRSASLYKSASHQHSGLGFEHGVHYPFVCNYATL